jgi:hypothetical protein
VGVFLLDLEVKKRKSLALLASPFKKGGLK